MVILIEGIFVSFCLETSILEGKGDREMTDV